MCVCVVGFFSISEDCASITGVNPIKNYHLNHFTVEVICMLAAMSDVPSYPDILTLNPNAILMPLCGGVITMDVLGDFLVRRLLILGDFLRIIVPLYNLLNSTFIMTS